MTKDITAQSAAWLHVEPYSAVCELKEFSINGIDASEGDFGDHFDHHPESSEDYGCGDMRFEPRPAEREVLDKYDITEAQYNEVCDALDCLSFGSCGWCV